MSAVEPFQQVPLEGLQYLVILPAAFGGGLLQQSSGYNEYILTHLHRHIAQGGVQGYCQVGGEGPGGGGPYQQVYPLIGLGGELLADVRFQGEGNIDGRGLMFQILHLRLCQGGAAVNAPVNRLVPSIHIPLFQKFSKLLYNGSFVGRVEGQIGLLPFA